MILTWTDERVEQLKKLWEAGLSCSQVAAELGGVTRNAVIGKVHRLGLSGRTKGHAEPIVKKARQARARGTNFINVRPSTRAAAALALAPDVDADADVASEVSVLDNVTPMRRRLSLIDLTADTCHWPIGDPQHPEFFFCGGKALKSLPYCAHHTRISIQPAAERRRQRSRE